MSASCSGLPEGLLKAVVSRLEAHKMCVGRRRVAGFLAALVAGLSFLAAAGATDISRTSIAEASALVLFAGCAAFFAFVGWYWGKTTAAPPLDGPSLTGDLGADDRQQAEGLLDGPLKLEKINRAFASRRDRAWWEVSAMTLAILFAAGFWTPLFVVLVVATARCFGLDEAPPLAGLLSLAPSMPGGAIIAARVAIAGALLAGAAYGRNAARPLIEQTYDDLLEAIFTKSETDALINAAQGRPPAAYSPAAAALLGSIDRALFALNPRRRR